MNEAACFKKKKFDPFQKQVDFLPIHLELFWTFSIVTKLVLQYSAMLAMFSNKREENIYCVQLLKGFSIDCDCHVLDKSKTWTSRDQVSNRS